MIRLFIALEIPDEVIDIVLHEKDKLLGEEHSIRWEFRDKLHITLKFLGDTDEALIGNIEKAIEDIVKNTKSFQMELGKFGIFRRNGEPKILWVGMKESNELERIVNEIGDSFTKFGYSKEERIFKPHVTLLRFRGHERIDKILDLLEVKLPEKEYIAKYITLYKSELKKGGSIYTAIKRFQLEK
ncbi:MAG: RNA 2',3'-cyclic phosphodiesterase [Melioribacteraceae bacterium]